MPKPILTGCVKSVKDLRIHHSVTSAFISPKMLDISHLLKVVGIKSPLLQPNLLENYTHLSTPKYEFFNLLLSTFTHYPQSLLISRKEEN